MKRPWFYRLLVSYLPIFLFVSSFLFFVFFQELSEQSKRGTVKANQVLNLMALNKVENSLKTIDYALIDFSLNNKVLNQFFKNPIEHDVILNREMLKEIQLFKFRNSLIESIYLVRFSDGIVLTEGFMFDLDEFPDRAYVQGIAKEKGAIIWTSVRKYQEFEHLSEKSLVTLARRHYTPTGGYGLIVVNVKSDVIRALVEQIYNEDVNFISVLGSDGGNILGNDMDDHKVLVENTSSYFNWTFRTGLVGGEIIYSLFELFRFWIILGILMVVLGFFAIVYVTQKNYRPLEKLVIQIREMMTGKEYSSLETAGSEFKLIESAVEDMLKNSNTLDILQQEGVSLRKKHFFYEIIQGIRYVPNEEWTAEMFNYGLPQRLNGAQVIAIEIDRYSAFTQKFSVSAQLLLKYAVYNCAIEIFHKHSLPVWCEWITGKQLICIVLHQEDMNSNMILETCEEFLDWVSQNLAFTITASIGAVVYSYNEISESYKEALQALKYKYLKGLGTFILLQELEVTPVELFAYLERIRSLAHDLRTGDGSWVEKFNQLCLNIRSDYLSSDEMMNLMNYLIFQLDRKILELDPEYQKPWKAKGMKVLTDVLETAETLQDIQHSFFNILYEIGQGILSAYEGSTHHHILLETRAYIEANFMDPDLSLDRLKDKFGLNPKYLSQLFKDKFGEGFMDFLIRLRMEHAKELLCTTTDPVQAIANKVGYLNVISFTRTFKKVTSMSPGEYRRQKGQA